MAIITIPKKKTSSPIVKEKRKAGTRAGLTKAAIVAAAAKLIESVGANGFSLRRLAKELGVGPTTIHFHFEGGIRAVSSAVAQQALAGVTRPYKPKEEPASYLGELLLKILEALHARPVGATVVVLQLSSNPVLDPLLAERVLLALAALGVPTEARPRMFRRAMGVIFEMILAECGRSSAADQKEASVQMHKTIAALSPTEFPNLDSISRGPRRRDRSGRSGKAISMPGHYEWPLGARSGRRRTVWRPGHIRLFAALPHPPRYGRARDPNATEPEELDAAADQFGRRAAWTDRRRQPRPEQLRGDERSRNRG